MTYYEDIYEIAADNYGLITTAQANEIGATNKDLLRYVKSGRLGRLGRGVYRLTHYMPVPNDPYAESVALVGDGAYLYGESVIAMHGLAPTNPARIFVATPKRVRKGLPDGLIVKQRADAGDVTSYEGIPSQSIPAAIIACKPTMLPERLEQAAHRAADLGLITGEEEDDLMKELSL